MTLEEVYQFYGSATKAAEAVNVTRQSFHGWLRQGFIPENQQKRYEKLTNGVLKASSIIEKPSSKHQVASFPHFRYYSETLGMCEVHSLTYFSEREPRIMYYCPSNRQLKFSSFQPENLMQSLGLLDLNNKMLYEGDMVLVEKNEFTVASMYDYEVLLKLNNAHEILIIGNLFEGRK
jgi:hypothetical protein